MNLNRSLLKFLAPALLLVSCASPPEPPEFAGPAKEFMREYVGITAGAAVAEAYLADSWPLEFPDNCAGSEKIEPFVKKNPQPAAEAAATLFERAAINWGEYKRIYNPNLSRDSNKPALRLLEFSCRDLSLAIRLYEIISKVSPESAERVKSRKDSAFSALKISD
jgi:hypothetical protein